MRHGGKKGGWKTEEETTIKAEENGQKEKDEGERRNKGYSTSEAENDRYTDTGNPKREK